MQTESIILCPTKRFARSLQLAHQQSQIALGFKNWQTLNVQTLDQWLVATLNIAMLSGEIAANQAPKKCLSQLEERLIWQAVISDYLKQSAVGDLFDLKGLAATCVEANRYMVAWRLSISPDLDALAEETNQFFVWQKIFQQRCQQLKCLENVRYIDWQIDCLAKQGGQLPGQITFAGFDQTAPQELRLREVLISRGCVVEDLMIGLKQSGIAEHIALQDEVQEMRAMVAWAKRKFDENPNIKLAMVIPNLQMLRNQIADLIDDVFQPEAIRPSLVESPRFYNFSLGLPLIQQSVIQAALNLLRLCCMRELAQTDVSDLLLSVYWSASEREADQRALLDADMRAYLPQHFTWVKWMSFIKGRCQHYPLTMLQAHLLEARSMVEAFPNRQMPSSWAESFQALLMALKWSGERADSSHEYQAKEAWQKALQALSLLDFLGEKMTSNGACALLQQICQEQVFQPETIGTPPLQVLGIMEALSEPVDAMWVMGMNDDHWPMPARPNPLLPAHIQRAARVANADSRVQAEFALTIHHRLMHSAPNITFSSSLQSGEKCLRASPLMQSVPLAQTNDQPANTLAEVLSTNEQNAMQAFNDDLGPVVQEGEHVRGGTGLIRAQAVCPAWAFYQFRLGAKQLKTPKSGLDASERGQLVHGALEAFWFNEGTLRHFADLQQMQETDLEIAISDAVNKSIIQFKQIHEDIFSPNTLMLEHERLCRLVADWLAFEKSREVRFTLTGCEYEQKTLINGIEVTLKVDRIHQLENGGVELVDYKTGQVPKMSSWGKERITEPQLPIYAVFYAAEDQKVVGVQFGMVKTKDHHFVGVSEVNFEVDADKRKPDFIREFEDWESLKMHWQASIESMVVEIKMGKAPVVFESPNDMLYCEVLPILRLPERQLQFERQLQTMDNPLAIEIGGSNASD
jgi:probable DNA repair protein